MSQYEHGVMAGVLCTLAALVVTNILFFWWLMRGFTRDERKADEIRNSKSEVRN